MDVCLAHSWHSLPTQTMLNTKHVVKGAASRHFFATSKWPFVAHLYEHNIEISEHIYLLRWLILLQPWKAPRLYDWYLSLRSPDPKLEAPVTGDASANVNQWGVWQSSFVFVLFCFPCFSLQFYRYTWVAGLSFRTVFLQNEDWDNRIAAFETISWCHSQWRAWWLLRPKRTNMYPATASATLRPLRRAALQRDPWMSRC